MGFLTDLGFDEEKVNESTFEEIPKREESIAVSSAKYQRRHMKNSK